MPLSAAVSTERQNVLAEMRQRHVLSAEADQWTDADMDLLLRLRNAEAAGAVRFLRRKEGFSANYAVSYKPAGALVRRMRLTKEGYDRYVFLKSQMAVRYFESRGIDAKWIFLLKDARDNPLFGEGGLLTENGDRLYSLILNGKPVSWKTAAGEIMGNRPARPSMPQSAPFDAK